MAVVRRELLTPFPGRKVPGTGMGRGRLFRGSFFTFIAEGLAAPVVVRENGAEASPETPSGEYVPRVNSIGAKEHGGPFGAGSKCEHG